MQPHKLLRWEHANRTTQTQTRGLFPMHTRLDDPTIKPLSVTIRDACKVTGLGRSKIYELIADGRLAIVKIDKRTLIPYDELARLVRPERSAA